MSFGRGYSESMPLREALNRLFEDSYIQQASQSRQPARARGDQGQMVPVNVFRSGDNVVVFAPMPGLQPVDVEITVAENVLSIRGVKRGHEERHDFLLHEWTVGPYYRDVELPQDVEVGSARASLDNGVLVVTFDRSERSKPRRIQIQSGSQGGA